MLGLIGLIGGGAVIWYSEKRFDELKHYWENRFDELRNYWEDRFDEQDRSLSKQDKRLMHLEQKETNTHATPNPEKPVEEEEQK